MEVFWTALVGVAGIAATFFAPAWASNTIERRREAKEFRRACRLVSDELYAVDGQMYATLEHGISGAQFVREPTHVPTMAWEAERSVLATLMTHEDWRFLSATYYQVNAMRIIFLRTAERAELHGEVPELTDERREDIRDLRGQLQEARERLETAEAIADRSFRS